jgi:hypothetical protein
LGSPELKKLKNTRQKTVTVAVRLVIVGSAATVTDGDVVGTNKCKLSVQPVKESWVPPSVEVWSVVLGG